MRSALEGRSCRHHRWPHRHELVPAGESVVAAAPVESWQTKVEVTQGTTERDRCKIDPVTQCVRLGFDDLERAADLDPLTLQKLPINELRRPPQLFGHVRHGCL